MARIEEISVKNYRVLQNITLKYIKKYGDETCLQKINFAEKIYLHMDVENNLSRSFQIFRDGLRSIVK
ncbi:MAG: hypothetical protein V7L29_09270 [Nostoc sp.]|uniref:hypothetical protein n=1 Tax=Nostoc sp. TaxID=1180 RepID=UPI002FF66A86